MTEHAAGTSSTGTSAREGWDGKWVARRLEVSVVDRDSPGSEVRPEAGLRPVAELAGLALRRNPKRAHLVVSPVLGKHVPVSPAVAIEAATDLGRRVAAVLASVAGTRGEQQPGIVVLGYAETATGLGHCVADALVAPYLHSTRRKRPGRESILGFEEAHSHAATHYLLPDDASLVDDADVIVLVDDELTTGATVLNTIRAIEERSATRPQRTYVVAALLDLRAESAAADLDDFAADLGVTIIAVALGRGEVVLPDGVLARGQELVASLPAVPELRGPRGSVRRLELTAGAGHRYSGRHGFTLADRARFEEVLPSWAHAVAEQLDPVGSVQFLGTEELMYAPVRLASAVAKINPNLEVTFSSTTRSPIAVVDEAGYPIRSVISFPGHDDTGDAPRFAYNLGQSRFDQIVVVLDPGGDTPDVAALGGLIDELSRVSVDVLVVVLPTEETS